MVVPLTEGACGGRRGSPASSASVFLFIPALAGGGMAALRAFTDEADISTKAPLTGDCILLLYCGNREACLKGIDQPVVFCIVPAIELTAFSPSFSMVARYPLETIAR